jgi:two-component sensor histidine kinase
MIQSERLAAIGQLIAGVAHELNNPLTGIMGYSQLLLSRPDASSVRGPLDRINREAIRMQKIVSNLLAFSRSHDPEWKLVGLNGLLEATIELVAYEFKVNNIRVETDFDPDLPMTLGDFHRIEQVFVNLITNALQAMADSHVGGALFLKTRQAAENGENWLRVNVKDDGPGIHPDHVARVFDPFFTTKPPGRGTGLGLALAQQIIQEHGGRIRVSSEPMKGTTFTVDLPLRTAVPSEGDSADEPASEGGSGGGQHAQKKAILVADDEPSILSLLYDTLKEKGYAVETAPSGNAALRKLKTRSFDLILTDVKMPGLSGSSCTTGSGRSSRPRVPDRLHVGDTVTEATRLLGDRRDRAFPAVRSGRRLRIRCAIPRSGGIRPTT